MADLVALVQQWRGVDRNPRTLKQLDQLLEDPKNADMLRTNLNPQNRLEFGTAGLRGKLQPGYNCMNNITVMQTAQGLCQYCLKHFPEESKNGIVVCRDARHCSEDFAQITAGIFVASGIKVYYFTQLSSTPYAAYFTEQLHCVCGVMVTASHNPGTDNGYKVYGMNCGIQVVDPHDVGIQEEILRNLEIQQSTYNYKDYLSEKYVADGLLINITEQSDIMLRYYNDIKKLCFHHEQNQHLNLQVQYSAMWGVGYETFKRSSKVFGLDQDKIKYFEDSCRPDPNFGGEPRPNPEERHNMERLASTADPKTQLIIANDPDADRMGLAERQPDGSFYIFHGNETGALLAEWMLENTAHLPDRCIACSTVSSQIGRKMAESYNVTFEDTLTGFKWLGLASKKWHAEHKSMIFGFEESIGFSCGGAGGLLVGDKDGVSTACVVCEMANAMYAKKLTLHGYLMAIYAKYGFYNWNNTGFTVKSMDEVKGVFGIATTAGSGKFTFKDRKYLDNIGRFVVNRIRDMKAPGYDSQDGVPKIPVSNSEMITFYCDEVTATLRPSGTEPKVKLYVEATNGTSVAGAKQTALEFTHEFMKILGRE